MLLFFWHPAHGWRIRQNGPLSEFENEVCPACSRLRQADEAENFPGEAHSVSRAVAAPETGGSEVLGAAATTLLGLSKGNLQPRGSSPTLWQRRAGCYCAQRVRKGEPQASSTLRSSEFVEPCKGCGEAENHRPPTDAARAGCCHAPETANKPQSPGCPVPIGQKSTPFSTVVSMSHLYFAPWSVLASDDSRYPCSLIPRPSPRQL